MRLLRRQVQREGVTVTAADQTPATDSEREALIALLLKHGHAEWDRFDAQIVADIVIADWADRKSTRLNSSHWE